MQQVANPLLVVLYWAVRAYVWLIFIWALMTWIPGVAGSQFHNIIGMPVLPLINLFSFMRFGPVGFGAVVVALLLNMVANWLAKQIMQQSGQEEPPMIEGAAYDQTTPEGADRTDRGQDRF